MPPTDENNLLLPKFLTKGTAEGIVSSLVAELQRLFVRYLKHSNLHVVVLVPKLDVGGGYPNFRIEPHIICECSFGNQDEWKHDYKDIARCKAIQLWTDRSDGSQIQPHLLFLGDTPFSGGVKRDGIVVACSGMKEYFDRMFAEMIAAALIGTARLLWEVSDDKAKGVDFLT